MHLKNVASGLARSAKFEPLYDVDPSTGAMIEVFFADRVFDGMRGRGWYWWKCTPGSVPEWPPVGPFATAYRAYCDVVGRAESDRERSRAGASGSINRSAIADTARTQQL